MRRCCSEHAHSLGCVFGSERSLQARGDVLPVRALGMIDDEPAQPVGVVVPTDAAGPDPGERGGRSALGGVLGLDLLRDEPETARHWRLAEHQLEDTRFGGGVNCEGELDDFK